MHILDVFKEAAEISNDLKYQVMRNYSDTQLHELARKRVDFRRHLLVYFIIMGVLWGLWYFSGSSYPWPVWPTAGWGIGIIFHYLFEYRSSKFLSEDEEYNKLKKEVEEKDSIHSNK